MFCRGGNEQKAEKSPKKYFFSCFCMRFLTAPVCVLFASALAGAKAQLKNMLKTIGFYDIICVCAVCARSANILQTERKSKKKLSKCKRKTACHGSSKKVAKNYRFGSQNGSQNRLRRPLLGVWRYYRKLKRIPKGRRDQAKTGPRAPKNPKKPKTSRTTQVPGGRVGGRGGERKSLPGG